MSRHLGRVGTVPVVAVERLQHLRHVQIAAIEKFVDRLHAGAALGIPLGQSGLIQGTLDAVDQIDPNFDSLQPIWRDWRFVPMLPLARDVDAGGSADSDGDQVADAFERWYFGDLSRGAADDGDSWRTGRRKP